MQGPNPTEYAAVKLPLKAVAASLRHHCKHSRARKNYLAIERNKS
jgi:hypothetical protein